MSDKNTNELNRINGLNELFSEVYGVNAKVSSMLRANDFSAEELECLKDKLDSFLLGVVNAIYIATDERLADVVIRRYGISTGEKETLEDIGKCFGLTRERIRQLQEKAIKKLSKKLEQIIIRTAATTIGKKVKIVAPTTKAGDSEYIKLWKIKDGLGLADKYPNFYLQEIITELVKDGYIEARATSGGNRHFSTEKGRTVGIIGKQTETREVLWLNKQGQEFILQYVDDFNARIGERNFSATDSQFESKSRIGKRWDDKEETKNNGTN